MNEIPHVRISEVANVTVGFVGKITTHYVDSGVPIIRSKDIVPYSILEDQLLEVSQEFHNSHSKTSLMPGDVVVVRTGKPGTACVIPNHITSLQCLDAVIVRCNQDRLLPDYYCAFMNSLGAHYVNSTIVGAVQQHFNVKVAQDMEIPLPSIEQQQKIVSILNSQNEAIKNIGEKSRIYRQLIDEIFHSWFIDFNPVRAKSKGNFPFSMDKKTAELFPNSFEDSELGPIPTGWRILTLDEILDTIIDHRGLTPKKLGGDWVEEGYPAISAMNIKDGKIVKRQNIEYINEEMYRKWMKVEVKSGDILLTSEAPLGEIYYLFDDEKMVTSQRVFGIRSNPNLMPSIFLRYYLDSHLGQYELHARASGSTVSGIRQSELRKIKIIIPPLEIMTYFSNKVKPLIAYQNNSDNQIISLKQTREALLPRLISGEILVS